MVKIAIPNKGRLSEEAIKLLRNIGLKIQVGERRLFLESAKYQILFVRAQDIPAFVEKGVADLGITGLDQVLESGKKIKKLLDLNFGYCRLAVAVPESSKIKAVRDIPSNSTVATSFPRLTKKYFEKERKKVSVVQVRGAVEVTPRIGVADLITDLVETGSTLKVNHLREIATILSSRAVVIGNKQSLAQKEKSTKLQELLSALASVTSAQGKRYLMANVPAKALEEVKALVPGISGPTIMNIMGTKKLVAIHAVVNESEINGVIAVLKRLGATGVLVTPIERMVV